MANAFKMGDAFDVALAGTDICADTFNLNMSRTVVEVRTSCGNSVVAGANQYTIDASGPLGFGTSSTDAVCFTSITATSAEAWEFDPDGTGTASTSNPIYSGTTLASGYNISASVGGAITYQYNATGTNSSGVPTRTTA
jgi:hypothetical protein